MKLTLRLTSQDFDPLPCNWKTGGTGACGYNNMCARIQMLSAKSNATTQEQCALKTQQKFKARMQQHFNELGKKSDTCTKHFVT